MNKIIFIFFILASINACNAQKSKIELKWQDFESIESGMKVDLPCEPKKTFKSFQEKPRPIYVYDFSCEFEGIKFLISSKHYLDEFNDKSYQQVFDSNELILKNMFGEIRTLDIKDDVSINGFQSKYYEVFPKSGGKLKSLIVVNKIRSYEALFGVNPETEKDLKNKNIDFESIGNRFIKSFQVIDKE